MESDAIKAARILTNGDCPPDDRWFHVDRIRRRVAALEDDAPIFGLVRAEKAELAALLTVLAREEGRS